MPSEKMPPVSSMGPRSFLDLPPEIRDLIYEYVALDVGIYLHPDTSGKPTSWTPISSLSHQLHDEYEDVLYTSAPVVSAYVHDFDFTHLMAFLDNLDRRSENQKLTGINHQSRELNITLILSSSSPSPARKNLDKLRDWFEHFSKRSNTHYSTAFTTNYSVHASSCKPDTGVAPVTLMRIIDEVYCDWFQRTPPGRYKQEIGKVCDCLAAVEMEINRRRSSAPRSVGTWSQVLRQRLIKVSILIPGG